MTDKNLHETLESVVGETKETPTTPKDTNEELSENREETGAGDTSKEYVSGVDISDVPAEQRPLIRKYLKEKMAQAEKGITPRFQKVADLEKTQEYIQQLGLSLDEVKKAAEDLAYQKRNPQTQKIDISTQKQEALNILDQAISVTPKESQAFLKILRPVIEKIDTIEKLEKVIERVENMEKSLGTLAYSSTNTRVNNLNQELDNLIPEYGKDIVEKYRSQVVEQGKRYIDASAESLLGSIAFAVSPSELKKSLRSKPTKQEEKLKAISSPGSGTTSMESIDTKKMSLKDVLRAAVKK